MFYSIGMILAAAYTTFNVYTLLRLPQMTAQDQLVRWQKGWKFATINIVTLVVITLMVWLFGNAVSLWRAALAWYGYSYLIQHAIFGLVFIYMRGVANRIEAIHKDSSR